MEKIEKGVFRVANGAGAVVLSTSKFAMRPPKDVQENDGTICFWGHDNLLPQRFLQTYRKTDAAVAGLEVLRTAHYGNGFGLFQEIETENGVEKRERSIHSFPEIKEFFKTVKWNRFISDIISDYETWNLALPEFLLSPDKSKIISVKRHQTPWGRFSVPKKGISEYLYLNSDWEENKKENEVKVPLIPDFYTAEEVKEYVKVKKIETFCIPVMGMLNDEKIYPNVGWHSAFHNGWVDTVLSVPEFKKFMFKNQLHFKYVIYVSDEFLTRKYGQETWQEYSAKEKEEIREAVINKIDETMSGNEASGRSLTSPYFTDRNGNLMKGIEIVPIDDKIKDGNFLPDAAAGNSQILFAMGVDPSIVGAGIPGGKNLSGSGSDKREAYTILGTRQPMKRIRTLEIFNFIRDYNGWDDTLEGNFPNQILTTLDKETSGQTEQVL